MAGRVGIAILCFCWDGVIGTLENGKMGKRKRKKENGS